MQFASALPGLKELIGSRPDLIVIDIGLHPQRDEQTGLQVIHAARSGSVLRDVPIIVLTTEPAALDAAWAELMERGDIHRLQKPFDVATLARVVDVALGRSRVGADSADHGLRVVRGEHDEGRPRSR